MNNMRRDAAARAAVAAGLLLTIAAPVALACTTLCFSDGGTLVFARNYDWNIGLGHLIVNKRGLSKTSFGSDTPATWTARYGSVTFNQYGRESPCGGMNEVGLVIELMWLDDTRYPQPDARLEVGKLGWIQYQLDTAASVADVVASDDRIRVAAAGAARVHYLVADREGAVAAIEFLDGRMVVHTGDDLPYPALTNDTYARSLAYAERANAAGFTGDVSSMSSLDRFVRASHASGRRARASGDPIAVAFDVLDDVAQGEYTQWRVVYDITALRVYFETRPARERRFLDLAAVDFSCATPAVYVDLVGGAPGDAAPHLQPHDAKANYKLIHGAVKGTTFLSHVTDDDVRAWADAPSGFVCEGAP